MFLQSTEPLIPDNFKGINAIQDYQIRTKLKVMVSRIFKLIQETRNYSYDLKTKNILDKFMIYLERVSQNHLSLLKWHKWIVKFGNIVIVRLSAVSNNTIDYDTSIEDTFDLLNKSVVNMIEIIEDFVVNEKLLLLDTRNLISRVLENIVENLPTYPQHRKHLLYKNIIFYIDLIIQKIYWMVDTNPWGSQIKHQESLFFDLSKLELKIRELT